MLWVFIVLNAMGFHSSCYRNRSTFSSTLPFLLLVAKLSPLLTGVEAAPVTFVLLVGTLALLFGAAYLMGTDSRIALKGLHHASLLVPWIAILLSVSGIELLVNDFIRGFVSKA